VTNDAPDRDAAPDGTGTGAPGDAVMVEAESWFLRHGLPSAVRGGRRWRGILARSAPALVGWATLMVSSLLIMLLSGDQDVDVDDDPTASQWLALVILVLLPVTVLGSGWIAHRIRRPSTRRIVAIAAIVIAMASDWWDDDAAEILSDALVDGTLVAAILVATGTGIGSVLGWSAKTTLTHLRAAGRLMVRALPVVLLTVLAFFNTSVWLVATNLDVPRMVLLVMFLALIAVSFLTAGTRDSLATVTSMEGSGATEVPAPFTEMTHPEAPSALTVGERLNLLVVVVISQIVQVLLLAVLTGAVFFVMGLIVLNPAVLAKLTSGASSQSVWFGFTVPLSAAHLHVVALLTALTFMYVCVKAVGDGEYRRNFLDPLLEDMRRAVAARHRYRASVRSASRRSVETDGR